MEEQMELFEDGGLKDEGGMVDEESGNEVPNGSTRKEVRDDVPAMLSEGEFVLPADVVRYHGLEKIMQLRDEAKFGLKKMEAMGQMGNSEEATLDDDIPFGPADLVLIAGDMEDNDQEEPREMAKGGVVYAQEGTFVPSTGIGGYQQSIYQGQQTNPAYTIPPSSVAPPPPTPSPAGGYIPKFVSNQVTPFDDGSLTPKPATSTTTTPTATDTSGVSTASTEDKFVSTVEDKYTTLKYINTETGQIRDFYFYNGSPVTPIPDGFVPYDETVDEVTDDLESTTVDTTQTLPSGDGDSTPVPTAEPVDYTSMSKEELNAAFTNNKRIKGISLGLAALNPLLGAFAQLTTRHAEAQIIEEMKNRGMEVPEVKGTILDKIIGSVTSALGLDGEKDPTTVRRVSSAVTSNESTKLTPSQVTAYENVASNVIKGYQDYGTTRSVSEPAVTLSSRLDTKGITPTSTPSSSGTLSSRLDTKGVTPTTTKTDSSSSTLSSRLDTKGATPTTTKQKEKKTVNAARKAAQDSLARAKAQEASNKVVSKAIDRAKESGSSADLKNAVNTAKESKRVQDVIKARQSGASIGFKQGGLVSRKKKK